MQLLNGLGGSRDGLGRSGFEPRARALAADGHVGRDGVAYALDDLIVAALHERRVGGQLVPRVAYDCDERDDDERDCDERAPGPRAESLFQPDLYGQQVGGGDDAEQERDEDFADEEEEEPEREQNGRAVNDEAARVGDRQLAQPLLLATWHRHGFASRRRLRRARVELFKCARRPDLLAPNSGPGSA